MTTKNALSKLLPINEAGYAVTQGAVPIFDAIEHNTSINDACKGKLSFLNTLYPQIEKCCEDNDVLLVDLANAIPFDQAHLAAVNIEAIQRHRVLSHLSIARGTTQAQLSPKLSPQPRPMFLILQNSEAHMNYILWNRYGGIEKRVADWRQIVNIVDAENKHKHGFFDKELYHIKQIELFFKNVIAYQQQYQAQSPNAVITTSFVEKMSDIHIPHDNVVLGYN